MSNSRKILRDVIKNKSEKTYVLSAPAFPQITSPNGVLDPDPACQALWYYYTIARKNYEEYEKDIIILEGELDPQFDNFQLFKSCAFMYGVAPERMLHFWQNVQTQCAMMGLPDLPEKYKYRKVAEIKTQ